MVKLLPIPLVRAVCSFACGNLPVRTGATARLFLKAPGGPRPGFEIQHLVPVSTVQQRNSILSQELGLVSSGVCNEQRFCKLLLKNSVVEVRVTSC